ncbi:alcohol dehydrogenase catalytic domain-containing protein [Actinocrispum sp. NPDC049592]|uniref:alcohol dehydrogenase catalytic domain-containing protein n=1 Tax=Actinocrispum sp. NPDC049592 TaxID=3154835 RepID=UPI00342C9DF1
MPETPWREAITAVRHRAMQVLTPGAGFTLTYVDTPQPRPGQVRVTVEACGVCHSDAAITAGDVPHVTFPLVTGHEIAGRIEALGDGVTGWGIGDRVAVGWYGGDCGYCDACRGTAVMCTEPQIPGLAYAGGFADSVTVPAAALAPIPDVLSSAEAAPLACAGVRVFTALRQSAARPGDLVAVVGLGGPGHLALQFAATMGLRTVSIGRGHGDAMAALELGADIYLDTKTDDVGAALRDLGGAAVIVAIPTNTMMTCAAIKGLAEGGQVIVLSTTGTTLGHALPGPKLEFGHWGGTAHDTRQTLEFAARNGVRPWVEQMPLEQAGTALTRMASGQARFRMVLTTT